MTIHPIAKLVLKWTVALTVLFVAVMGFAHTPWGRPILGWFSGVPGCPLGFDDADPVQTEVFRTNILRKNTAGAAPSRATPALAFDLGRSTRADVETWAKSLGLACESKRQGSVLNCPNASAADTASPPIDELHLQFDPQGTLVAVNVFRKETKGPSAVAFMTERVSGLQQQVGPPTKADGKLDASWLDGGAFHVARQEFRYKDYLAVVSATNMGARGVRLREEYQWAAATP